MTYRDVYKLFSKAILDFDEKSITNFVEAFNKTMKIMDEQNKKRYKNKEK